MKLLIMRYIERFPFQGQEPAQIALERLINVLKTTTVRKSGQEIEMQDDQSVRTQIDSVLDSLDINTFLDSDMPNTGGMEVMATIKRDLSLELEAMLATQKN